MFSDKRSREPEVLERNIIGQHTTIVGDINSKGDFRVDGTVEGTIITTGRVVIGIDGKVKGNVECANADIEGKFSGKMLVKQTLSLKASATINGEVVIGKLAVEPGANFNASCNMKGSVKELRNEQSKEEKTA